MNKYAYCTVITNDDYTPCVIRQKQRMEYLQCQYPFIVIVTDNTPQETIKELEKHNIEYKIVPYFSFIHKDKHYQDTINKFHILSLIQYETVMFLDADTILIDNFDYLFDKYKISLNHHFYFFASFKNEKAELNADGTFFFCKPNMQLHDFIFKKHIKLFTSTFLNDEHLINSFFFHCIHLDLLTDLPQFLHFAGTIKLWELKHKSSYVNNFFYTFTKNNFNQIIDMLKYNSEHTFLSLMNALERVNVLAIKLEEKE